MEEFSQPGLTPSGNIVALLCHDASAESCMRIAINAARRLDAGLTGLSLSPPSRGFDAEDRLNGIFSTLAAEAGVNARWCFGGGNALDVAIAHAKTADLVIAPQEPSVDVPYNLIRETGRPVVLVPRRTVTKSFGARGIVAWDGSREAARAVADALPLLRSADDVVVFNVYSDRCDETCSIGSDTDIGAYLRSHEIPVSFRKAYVGHVDVGRTIVSRTAEMGADLLVMGASGRPRPGGLRLGGVTRYVLDNMTVPVLMSC